MNNNEEGIRCYDIWMADLSETENSYVQHGIRPVIVVSNNMANRYSPVISVVPITSNLNKKPLPTHVSVQADGLARDGLALCEQVTTVDKWRLIRRMGWVNTPYQRNAIRRGLAVQLGLEV